MQANIYSQNTSKFDLPSGPNEHYKDAIKQGDRLILTAKYGHRGGKGNKIVILEGVKEMTTISEHSPWDDDENLALFAGNKFTDYSSVGLLNRNIIVVTAGKRGVIAIPIDQIKIEEKTMYGYTYDVPTPHDVKTVSIGTYAEELATVKDKTVAYVLGKAAKEGSVLAEVKWSVQKNDLEVIRSHNIQESYERFFIEV